MAMDAAAAHWPLVTEKVTAGDVIELSDAVMAVVPTATGVAKPVPASMVAVAGVADDHDTEEVTFCVGPDVNVPVAVNCREKPTASLAVAGVTWIDTSAAAVTVSVAAMDLTGPSDAVMLVAPAATVVARPAALMVALLVSLESQPTDVVISGVVPSE